VIGRKSLGRQSAGKREADGEPNKNPSGAEWRARKTTGGKNSAGRSGGKQKQKGNAEESVQSLHQKGKIR